MPAYTENWHLIWGDFSYVLSSAEFGNQGFSYGFARIPIKWKFGCNPNDI